MTDPLAALDALTRAVGDFVWLVHLWQSGSCYLCGAGEGIAHDSDKACGEVQVAHTAALAVLHHQPTAPAEGLDVARLAQMDYAFWPEDTAHRWCDEDSGGLHRFDVASWAEDFAREYAALTPEDDR